MSEPITGSIGVAVVPNAERFWEDFKAKTAAGAEGAAPTVRVRADVTEVERSIAEVKATAAASSATVHVKADTRDAQFQMHLLQDAIIGLGPAAIPLAGVIGGALLGVLPTVATLGLGIKGISDEFKSGQLAASTFGGTLSTLQGEFSTLKTTAAQGLLGGIQQAVAKSQPLFASLNSDIGTMSAQIGQIVAGAGPALVALLHDLNPLFVTLGQALTHGAQSLEHFATSGTGVSSFVAYVQAELPQVEHVLAELVTTVSHLVQGFAPLGSGVLGILGGLSAAINAIPVPVLQVLVPVLSAVYLGFRTLGAVNAIVRSVSGALANFGESAETSTLRATVASKQYELAVQIEAAAVARAKAEEAAATAAASAEIAASMEAAARPLNRITAALAEEAAASSAAASEFAAAMAAEAVAAETSAATIAASAQAAADALDTAGVEASASWYAILGPLAAVAVGVGLLVAAFGHSNKAEQEAKQAADSYSTALQNTTDALNSSVIAQTNDNLSKSGALRILDQLHSRNLALGVSYKDLTLAVNGTTGQFNSVVQSLIKMADPMTKTGRAVISLLETLGKYRGGVDTAIQTQTELNKAMEDSLGISNSAAVAAAGLYGLVGTNGVNAYLAAQTAAKNNTDQTQAQTLAFQLENDAVSLLNQALNGLAGDNLNTAQAQTALAVASGQVAASMKTNGTAIDGNSNAAVANQQAIQQSVTAAQQLASAIGKQTGSTDASVASFTKSKKALEDQLRSQGKLTPAVQAYIDKLYDLKDLKVPPTQLDINKTAAEADLKTLQAHINAVHGKTVVVNATVNGSTAVYEIAGALETIQGSDVTITRGRGPTSKSSAQGNIFDFYANGGVNKFADGAHVAQIAPAGAMRLWAEPETGGEAYIPLAPAKRERSTAILAEVAHRFGDTYRPQRFAEGGITLRTDAAPPSVNVRVYVGNQEITDIARVVVDEAVIELKHGLTYR